MARRRCRHHTARESAGAAICLGAVDGRRRRRRSGDPARGDQRFVAALVAPRGSTRRAAALAPVVADENETHDRYEEHPLHAHAPLIHECLSAIADTAGYLIVISDADGTLLTIEGTTPVRLRAAGDMNFAEGTLWSEGGAGTNAIGTAIAVDHAVQVFGPEHFSDPVQRWTCSACPDPRPGHRRGDRRDRPHGRSRQRPPALARRRHRDRPRRRGQPRSSRCRSATRACTRATAAASRPDRTALVTPYRPHDRRRPARLEARRAGSPSRPAAARSRSRPARPRSPSRSPPRSRPSSCTRVESKRVSSIPRPLVKLSLPRPRPRAAARSEDRITDAAPAPRRDPRAAVRAPGRDERRAAVRRPARRRRQRLLSVRVEVQPAAQAARPVDRHRPLPPHVRRRDRRPPRRGPAQRAARSARPPRPTPARCCRRSEAPGVVARARAPRALAAPGRDDGRGPRGAVGLPAASTARTTSAPGSGCSRSSSSAIRAEPSPPPAWASCGVQRSCNA